MLPVRNAAPPCRPRGRCPKCGDRKPRGDAFGESLLAKLEAAEGKPLALKERAKPAAERQGKAKPIQTAVALIAAGLGLAGAVVAMVYLINRDRPINSVGGDTNVAKMETFFTVKLKLHGDKGKVVRRKQFNSQEHVNRLLDAQGKVALGRELKKTVVDEVDFEEIVLEIDEGATRPKKFQRTYSRARGKEDGQPRVHGYEGRTVVFDLEDNAYKATVLGELGLDEAELKELASRVATQERVAAFLPAKGNVVKVGEPWPIDLAAFSRILSANATIDSKNSTGKARLFEVRERANGQRVGEIHMDLVLSVQTAAGRTYKPPAIFSLKCTWDVSVDAASTAGTLASEGGMTWTGEAEVDGQKYKHEIVSKIEGKDERWPERDP